MKNWVFVFITLAGLLSIGVSFAMSPTIGVKEPSTDSFSVGWVGDMVPAQDDVFNTNAFAFIKYLTQRPSLMIGNLEGTFAEPGRTSKCGYIETNCHAFRGTNSFTFALKDAGFDLVSLVNNHSYDYGDDGLLDTEKVLEQAGIAYISQTHPTTTLFIGGKKVGVVGVSSTPPASTITNYEYISNTISELRKNVDIVILIFHGGAEGSDKTIVPGKDEYLGTEDRGDVEHVAHTAIDAGADMVLGSGPHVLRKTEYYKNKPIVYSAGNAIGGNERLLTNGILGVSGIFTFTEQKDNSFDLSLTSLLLSKEGIPSVDTTEQAKMLVESLAK